MMTMYDKKMSCRQIIKVRLISCERLSSPCHTVPKACARGKFKKKYIASPSLELTWALCEVVKAAVLGCDAAHVAVTRPVHTVHPPVDGGAAQLSASAALPCTASRHWLDATQRQQQQQQQAGGLGRGSHRRDNRSCQTSRWKEERRRKRRSLFLDSLKDFSINRLTASLLHVSHLGGPSGHLGISKAKTPGFAI